ncbi:MAG TPA: T9SS type A sorting domain-containing protein, partial [bacterium]
YDVYSARSVNGYPYTHGGWRQFSGTSAAGPHVAASAVLARAADTTLTRIEIEGLLESFAISDSFTGPVYNDTWGYGKVRIDELVQFLGITSNEAGAALPTTVSFTAFPNPFNSTVSIRIELPFSDAIEVAVYDLMGRKVADIYRGIGAVGSQRLDWNAQHTPSGVYWIRLQSGAQQEVQKMVVLK